MIGTLARKRNNLVALTALVALIAALFIGLQSASASPKAEVTSDSDGTVKSGTDVVLSYTVSTTQAGSGNVTWTAPKGQEVFFLVGSASSRTTVAAADANVTLKTTGAADGTYTIVASRTDAADATVDVTIGDPGDEVGSGAFTLAYRTSATDRDFDRSTTTGAVQDKDSTRANATDGEGEIGLVLTIKNERGNKANDGESSGDMSRSGVSSISVVVPGGKISAASTPGDGNNPNATNAAGVNLSGDNADAQHWFNVKRDSAGTLEVWAIIVGSDGSTATTPKIALKFTGDPETISLSDASASLGDKDNTTGIYVDVTAKDKSGNASAFTADNISGDNQATTVTATVKSGPDGAELTDLTRGTLVLGDGASGNAARGAIRIPITVTAADSAPKPGEWTLEVNLGTKDTQTATFAVVGAADSVELSADMTEATFGDIVTLTATVKDKNGNPVANTTGDNDGVSFTWAESGLKAQSLDDSGVSSGNKDITKGEATARFVVTSRTGDALVIASSSGKKATIALSAPAPVVDEPDEPTVDEPTSGADCLDYQTGPASWTCDSNTYAKTLLDETGAAAISLYNRESGGWQSYTGGFGSSANFLIQQGDYLWITP